MFSFSTVQKVMALLLGTMANYTELLQTSHKFQFQLDSLESRHKKQCPISVKFEN